eukprot:CAMPEP_0113939332 /NCGR_PEP_ID=MMETSP1339-20121228/5664_1 /TAXON_ID=94617 /ORGANISM="Fibrocapsa japonica" /LENGTH=346 /DNA_ID=CAMNT_0000942807 /DNA_START=479 /DNA_END=1519 /DNA_ORIENTATION=+ /assembly_acc=CAM_ASM_000762
MQHLFYFCAFRKEVSIFKESPNYLLESKAKKIYKSYIKSQSEQEVNLSSAQKADILDNLKKIFQDPVKKELRFDHVSEWQFQEDDNDPVWSKRRALFDDAQMEIFNLMKMDVFPRFMHKVSTFQKLSLAKDLALWWKSTEALTVSSFFTFPTEINAAEGRCVAAMTVTTVFVTLLVDVYFSQPWVGMYVLYNFIVRVVSGPRLSPDSFIALFVLHPLMVKFKVLEDEFVNGTPRRFAQCVGMIWSAMCIALRLSVSQSPWISWIFWLILAVLSSSVVLFDFCVACAIWHALEMIQVISKPCEPCSANKVCVKSSSDSINKQTSLGRLVPSSYLVKVAPTTCCVSEP